MHPDINPSADPLTAFLSRCGWETASQKLLNANSSSRRYYRLKRGNDSAVLMVGAPDGSPQATPGHSISDFVRIGAWLRDKGLHAPEIYGADEAAGFLLLEDMGDVSFKHALQKNVPPRQLYGLAVDVLTQIRQVDCHIVLPDYYESHVHKGRRRLVDWYMPVALGRQNSDGLVEEYLRIWDDIEKQLPPCPQGFLHIDYHVENLMWMPGESGPLATCGLLDFQGAMKGPVPYDLANLLEDARLTLSPNIRKDMLDHYCEDMESDERDLFENWYRVLATQFHCRVIGQFVRLAVRDNRPRYLEHLPRLARYLEEGLEHPLLKPLASFLKEEGLLIEAPKPAAVIKYGTRHIRPDAF